MNTFYYSSVYTLTDFAPLSSLTLCFVVNILISFALFYSALLTSHSCFFFFSFFFGFLSSLALMPTLLFFLCRLFLFLKSFISFCFLFSLPFPLSLGIVKTSFLLLPQNDVQKIKKIYIYHSNMLHANVLKLLLC